MQSATRISCPLGKAGCRELLRCPPGGNPIIPQMGHACRRKNAGASCAGKMKRICAGEGWMAPVWLGDSVGPYRESPLPIRSPGARSFPEAVRRGVSFLLRDNRGRSTPRVGCLPRASRERQASGVLRSRLTPAGLEAGQMAELGDGHLPWMGIHLIALRAEKKKTKKKDNRTIWPESRRREDR